MKAQSCFIPIRIAAVMALFVFLPVWSTAQHAYYYTFDGEKVMLEASDEYLVIKPAESQEKGQLQTRLLERFPSAEVQKLRGVKSEGFLTVRSDQPLYSERSELNLLNENRCLLNLELTTRPGDYL